MSVLLVSFALALLTSLLLSSRYSPFKVMDAPNERSLHVMPTPRSGGLGILVGTAAGWTLLCVNAPWFPVMGWIIAAASAIAVLSLLDDILGLSPITRFIVHALAASLLLLAGLALPWGAAGVVITWLAIVWMVNLYNFMDGMDGFAGGMTLFGFLSIGLAGWLQGQNVYAFYAWAVAAPAFGFLWVNFPPARIFMGDVGSVTMGFLAAAFSLWGLHDGLFPLWFPILVFSPFIVDASITLTRRALRGERVWEAHRSHYYQRLVQAGWGHRKTVLVEYALMLLAGASGLALLVYPDWQIYGLVAWVVIYIVLAIITDVYCRRHMEQTQ